MHPVLTYRVPSIRGGGGGGKRRNSCKQTKKGQTMADIAYEIFYGFTHNDHKSLTGCPHSIPNDDGRDHFILDMWSKFSRTTIYVMSAHFATTTVLPIFGHILVGGNFNSLSQPPRIYLSIFFKRSQCVTTFQIMRNSFQVGELHIVVNGRGLVF